MYASNNSLIYGSDEAWNNKQGNDTAKDKSKSRN